MKPNRFYKGVSGFLILILLVGLCSAYNIGNSGITGYSTPYYSPYLIQQSGKTIVPADDTLKQEFYSNLRTIVHSSDESFMDLYYYPKGPIIGLGYNYLGDIVVHVEENTLISKETMSEIEFQIRTTGKEHGIDDISIVFMSDIIPILDKSRSDVWRPVIGGILISTGLGQGTLGYAARDRSGNLGYVTAGHVAGPIGSSVFQPGSPSLAGTVTKVGGIHSDSAFVQFSSVQASIFESEAIQRDIKYVLDPGFVTCTMSGISSGAVSGPVIEYGSLYNSYFGRTLFDQIYIDYDDALGDSGAPVYYFSSGNCVLGGIHWGHGRYSVASPISQVWNDLGVVALTR
ncbi:MAG: hypothetical protein WC164_04630 [Patescibacteria group bacterium]|nr:hypothetical protein [Methanoregulaceae archaeon]